MRKITLIITALVLALTIAGTLPAQVFADSIPEYISEVMIGMGEDAAESLEGYTILSDEKGNPIDLNQKAGGGWGSKGEKVIYLGYKTTTDRKEAITDLALMNMKGGYSVQDYELLMEYQMKSQIIPFVENFQAAIDEYRVNYYSDNAVNQAKAQYVHDALNLLTDDDCDGKGLGELLLNDTKYEMGVKAYNKLSAEEKAKTDVITESNKAYDALPAEGKKNHADILTILAQSNGKATLMMENLITRAADTNEESWLDRFAGITYKDLADSLDMLPTDAEAELAKMYDDSARKILNMWEEFNEDLLDYENAYKIAENFDADAYKQAADNVENLTDKSTDEQIEKAAEEFVKQQAKYAEFIKAAEIVAIHSALEDYEYGEGTLLDFFSKPKSEIEQNITVLYPLVASLSDGQIAGIEFVSMRELFVIALTDEEGYANQSLDDMQQNSIYDGVDREIYRKGGVALTSDALRKDAISRQSDDGIAFSGLTITLYVLGGLAAAGLIASSVIGLANKFKSNLLMAANNAYQRGGQINLGSFPTVKVKLNAAATNVNEAIKAGNETLLSRSSLCGKLALGFAVAMIVIAAISVYYTYEDLVEHYKVKFTPIPIYMVDEKDIVVFDANGDKTVLKNQTAYYRAVECNRDYSDEMYEMLGTCADMNGDVGSQWLALYAQKSDSYAPILADSLLVKVNDADLPAGYTTGIHMFGNASAFNLNSELYDWNKDAPGVRVYYKTASTEKTAATAGSNFTAGNLALAGVAGLAVGALVTALAVTTVGKKKKTAAA